MYRIPIQAFDASAPAAVFATVIGTGDPYATSQWSAVSRLWLSPRRGPTSGSARDQMGICRPQDATPEAGSNTGIIRAGALCVMRLLETTLIRVGNLEYARANGSFGLTTLRDRHVQIAGATLQFSFRGKSGKYHTVRLHDRRLATIVKRCQDLPGQELFQYIDAAGERRTVDSADVNDYLRHHTGQDFTAKDVRTWAGTLLAADALREYGPCAAPGEATQRIVQAMEAVAKRLGNTRAVCRACYVHPAILEAYLDGSLCALPLPRDTPHSGPEVPGLHPEEALVLTLLKQRRKQPGLLSQQAR